jgi:hypothetical protein
MSSMEVFPKHPSKCSAELLEKQKILLKSAKFSKVFKLTQERNDFLIIVKMYIITHQLFSLYICTFQMKKVEDRGKED